MARILITDDDVHIRRLFRALLEAEGHEAGEASDGAEALRACREELFDVVLCDLVMPNREGLETIRELRRWFPGLAIVAMSGAGVYLGRMDMLRAARLMGANTALRKPFGRQELLGAIEEALASAG
jgi:CheY-like chemotaxis protein